MVKGDLQHVEDAVTAAERTRAIQPLARLKSVFSLVGYRDSLPVALKSVRRVMFWLRTYLSLGLQTKKPASMEPPDLEWQPPQIFSAKDYFERT